MQLVDAAEYASIVKRPFLAVAVVLSLATSACSSAAPTDDAVAASAPPSTGLVDGASGVDEQSLSLGERESSFGPGSSLVAVSQVAERLDRLSEEGGEWFPFPHYIYEPESPECGYTTPIALKGQVQSRESVTDAPFSDTVGVEVMIYADEAVAAGEVAVLNGPNASACDVADGAKLKEALEGPESTPGVEFDVGDGKGAAADVPFDHPNAAARRFVGTMSIGAESRQAEVIEWVAADGPMVVRASAFSLTGRADELVIEMAEVLLTDQFPVVVEDAALDEAVDVVRRAVLEPDVLPSYFEESDPVSFHATTPRTTCYDVLPELAANGPGWLAITPGVGGSRVEQSTLIFPSAELAQNAVEELIAAGIDCYQQLVDLPEPMFSVVDGSITTEMVGDREVVNVQLDFVQDLNGAEFEADADMAVVQDGRFVFLFEFFGLAGDSPNLGELAVSAADRVAS